MHQPRAALLDSRTEAPRARGCGRLGRRLNEWECIIAHSYIQHGPTYGFRQLVRAPLARSGCFLRTGLQGHGAGHGGRGHLYIQVKLWYRSGPGHKVTRRAQTLATGRGHRPPGMFAMGQGVRSGSCHRSRRAPRRRNGRNGEARCGGPRGGTCRRLVIRPERMSRASYA